MTNWEDIRKQARRYENNISQKLVALNKLGLVAFPTTNDATEPLLSTEQAFETAVNELKQLLSTLNTINDKLGDILVAENGHASGVMVHTLQRHRELFQDYTQEFQKTQQQFTARREREDLLQNVRNVIDAYKTSPGNNRKFYSKENHHLESSNNLVDDQLSIAFEIKDNLVSQTIDFKKIQSRLHGISSSFPQINGILQKVNLRKRRDSLIMGLVMCFCALLMMAYALS